MGGTGDSPVPIGDPPIGMSEAVEMKHALYLLYHALAIASGGSPDGTGW